MSGNATSDSDLDLHGDDPIILIRTNSSGSELQINDGGDLSLSDFFGVGGEGRDLSFYLMLTRDTSVTHSFTVEDTYNRAGSGYLNLHNLPTAAANAWGGIESGEHFVFAIARDHDVNAHPEFPASFYVRAVDENVLIGTNVGSAITATDPDNDTLSYALSGTGAGDFNVSSAGQITAAVATLDHETTNSYSLTLTASDGNGGEASATVIITINDLDERPSLTPDPSGETWHRNTNQQFTVANTPGIIAVMITETVDTGNLTLHTTENDLSCSNQTNEFTVNTASTIWIRFCQNGTVSLRAEDRDDSTNFRDYTVTIAATNNAPEFAEATYSRAVNENVSSGSNVGTAVTAADVDGDTLSYSLSGTGSANFAVNRGQITTVSGFSPNFEDTESYSLTLTADDGNGGSDTATVNITINNVDDAPAIDPSPTTTAMATGRNYRFRVSARLGVQNVIVRDAPGNISGDITLRSTEAGLSCDNQSNELQLASVAEFWVRACAHGTATISIEEQDSAVDIRRYTVTIAEAVTVPDAPANLQGSPGDASVVLTWQEPADGGSEILRYEYTTYETPSNDSYWRSTGGTSLTYTVTQTSDQANPTNLVNGTSYPIFVRAVNVEGAGPRSNRVAVTPTPPTVPDAPTNLAATPGNGQVELTWDAPDDGGSNITRYEYSTDNGTTWTSTGGTATSYTATQTSGSPTASLSNGTEYTFRVRAVNGVGDSGPSGSQTATPLGPPGTPGNLQVSPGNQEVRLTWNAAAANGANITRYEYSSDNGSSWRTTGSTSRSYTATTISGSGGTTLQNGTEYTFRVRAVNSEGNGPQSNSQTATPTTNTVPGQVIGLMSSPGDGFLDLSWDEPPDGGSAILRYEYQTTNNPWESIGSTDTTFRATRRSGNGNAFVNGVFYGVRIRAVNATGNGAQSAGGGGVPNNQPPAFSSNTASRSVNENELSGTDVGAVVTATDPESDSINYSITGSNPGSFNIDASSGQIETGQLLNHEATDSYTIRVRASATGGSDNIDVTITVNDVNEAPSFASSSYSRSVPENSVGGTNVGVAVAATDPDDGESLAYTLYNGQGLFTVTNAGQIRVANNAGLNYEATTNYSLTLRATDGHGLYDEASVTINVSDVDEAAVLGDVDVNGIARSEAEPEVALTNPDSLSTTVYFRYRTPVGSGTWLSGGSDTTSGTSASVRLTGLTAGAQYRVQASLSLTFGDTVQADFTTIIELPGAPAAPTATEGDTELNVTWAAPADNGGSAIIDYDLQYRPQGGQWAEVSDPIGTSTTYTLTSLTNGTAYDVQVRAENSAGDGDWSDYGTGLPLPTPSAPDAPVPILTPAHESLQVGWAAPYDGRRVITQYDVRWKLHSQNAYPSANLDSITGTPPSTHYLIDDLANETVYDVQVRATNPLGTSPWSAAVSGGPERPTTVPGAIVRLRASAEGELVNRFPLVGSTVYIHGDFAEGNDVISCTGTLRGWVEGHEDPFNDSAAVADSSYAVPGSKYQQAQLEPKTAIYALQAPDGTHDEASCLLYTGKRENRRADRVRVKWIEDESERPIIDWMETIKGWPGGIFMATLAFPILLGLSVGAASRSTALAGGSFLVAFGFLSAVVGLSMLALLIVIVVALGFGLAYTILAKGT